MPKVGKPGDDVRLPEDVPLPGMPDEPMVAVVAVLEPVPPTPGVRTVVGEAELQVVVAAMHADDIVLGFVHANGSNCACRYLATMILREAGLEVQV